MYVKTTTRQSKAGTVRYLHLAHNEWDAAKGRSVPRILYSFGREDELDKEAVRRLVASLGRLLDPGDALAASADTAAGLEFTGSRPYGGAYVLDQLWQRLGIGTILAGLASSGRGRPRDAAAAERVLFGLVANRALAPASKLAASEWMSHDVHVAGIGEVTDDACYWAMDWLHRVCGELEKQVYFQVADLLSLQVDLLFFDTTSTYFELEEPDEPVARGQDGRRLEDRGEEAENAEKAGFRTYGKSKDSRDDLPQVIIGMAVTRDGIPVRCWCWPGNASDQILIRQVKDDMRDWTLAKIVWVADRGFASEQNRRYLRQGDHHYIIGEKLRSGSAEVKAALSRQGRYTQIAGNMRVKEVRISDSERFVICHHPEAAERDRHVRAQLVAQLEELTDGSDQLSDFKRGELRGRIAGKPGLNRYLRTTPSGKLRTDHAKIEAEENLDGKYLLRCSDPHLSAEDIATGYKQLLEVERGWRDMKQVIDLRPVYHRLEERIRAHVVLCWLALLLVRITETTAGVTWPSARRELDRLHTGTFTGPAGTFQQLTALTSSQRDLLAKLAIPVPRQIIDIQPATR